MRRQSRRRAAHPAPGCENGCSAGRRYGHRCPRAGPARRNRSRTRWPRTVARRAPAKSRHRVARALRRGRRRALAGLASGRRLRPRAARSHRGPTDSTSDLRRRSAAAARIRPGQRHSVACPNVRLLAVRGTSVASRSKAARGGPIRSRPGVYRRRSASARRRNLPLRPAPRGPRPSTPPADARRARDAVPQLPGVDRRATAGHRSGSPPWR